MYSHISAQAFSLIAGMNNIYIVILGALAGLFIMEVKHGTLLTLPVLLSHRFHQLWRPFHDSHHQF